jgi:hypothetical protein
MTVFDVLLNSHEFSLFFPDYITKIYSEWKGKTAAGLNYLKNPKYMVTISDKGNYNT